MKWIRRHRDLLERIAPDVDRGRDPAPAPSFGDPRLVQRTHPMSTSRAVTKTRAGRRDASVAALRTDPQVLPAGELSPLCPRTALELHDVQGEVHHRRVADVGAHAVRVDVAVEPEDGGFVEAAGDEDLHVREPDRK